MPTVGGADGCKRGWVLVTKYLESGVVSWQTCELTENLVYGPLAPDLLGLDIPIGLPDSGPRQCDVEARVFIGPRRSSVFPAPIRCVLCATTYREACELRYRAESKKMSQQAWHIIPKIRAVDSLLRRDPALQQKIREVHPEVCFRTLAGRHLMHAKKTTQGREERIQLLEPWFGDYLSSALAERRELGCALDDLLDAFVACWTAERIYSGRAKVRPPEPPRDSAGIRMEIVS